MTLQRQIIDIPVGGGLDELTGSMQTPAGKLVKATNARITEVGTCEQRPGYVAMASTVTSSWGVRSLMRCGSQMLLDNGENLYSWTQDSTTWHHVDLMPEAMIDSVLPGERGMSTVDSSYDATYASGMFFHAWVALDKSASAGGAHKKIRVRVTDEATGSRMITAAIDCDTDSHVRILYPAAADRVIVVYSYNRNICARYIMLATPITWSAEAVICASSSANNFDAQVMGDHFVVAASSSDPAPDVVVVHDVGVDLVVDHDAHCPNNSSGPVAVVYDAGGAEPHVYCAYQMAAGGIEVATFTFVLGTITYAATTIVDAGTYDGAGGTRVKHIGLAALGGSASCVYSLFGASAYPAETRCRIITEACAMVAGTGSTYNIEALGMPRKIGDLVYCVAHMPINVSTYSADLLAGGLAHPGQYHAWLVAITNSGQARPVCRLGWAKAFPGRDGNDLCVGLNPCTGGYVTAVGMLGENSNAPISEGFDLYLLDFTPAAVPLGIEQDGELVMSGGTPTICCGDRVSEYGFHWYPWLTLDPDSSGALTAGATYGYAVCYAQRDAMGVVHRSAPITASIVLGAGDDEVILSVGAYTLTTRQDSTDSSSPVQIEIYRTLANGTTYYFLLTLDNDPAAAAVYYDDTGTVSETDLATRRKLYTTGDVVENISPPASVHVIEHNNRLWSISADDRDRIWLSKLLSAHESPGFNETYVYRIPGAQLTALASLDGKLIALAKRGVYAVFGSGPNDLGQGNDLSEPQQISRELGCVDARSVCTYPSGVLFQGIDGLLYQIGADMAPKCISMPVRETLKLYPTVLSVVYVPDAHEVRALCSDGSNSIVLVWNIIVDQWHTWELKNAAGAEKPLARSAALVAWSGYPDQYAVLLNTTVVLRETGWIDPDATYPRVTIRTGPLRLAGLQGFQRLWDVGLLFEQNATDSAILLKGFKDYLTNSTTWSTSWTTVEAGSATTTPRAQFQVHVPLAHQKCEAMAFELQWVPVNGNNLRFQGLSLNIGIKAGRGIKLPAAARK